MLLFVFQLCDCGGIRLLKICSIWTTADWGMEYVLRWALQATCPMLGVFVWVSYMPNTWYTRSPVRNPREPFFPRAVNLYLRHLTVISAKQMPTIQENMHQWLAWLLGRGALGGGGTSILGSTGDVPLDRVPYWASSFGTGCLFWASGIGTGSFFELSALGTRLACILLIFQAIISKILSYFSA